MSQTSINYKKNDHPAFHLSGPSLLDILALPVRQGVQALRQDNFVPWKSLEVREDLVDPGNLWLPYAQGDPAGTRLDCQGLLSVLSLLGSLAFQADHRHRSLGVLAPLEVQLTLRRENEDNVKLNQPLLVSRKLHYK